MAKQRRIIIAVVFALFFSVLYFTIGSASAVSPPEDADYGFSVDEQQGGGGLVGEVVRVLNGNTIEYRKDIYFPSPNRFGLSFHATYNSRSGTTGYLGNGWTHTYEVSLDPSFEIEAQTLLKIIDGTGRAAYFQEVEPGVYGGAFNERSHVKAESGGYVWYRLNRARYGFSGSGQLLWIDDEKANRLNLTYNAQGRPETVTDTVSGRTLTFHYNAGGRLENISGPTTAAVSDGIWVSYGYDENGNLISVTYADGSGFTHTYNDPNDVHNLTEKRDKLNHLLKNFTYDTQDRVTSHFCVKGRGVTISYVSPTGVEVTDAYGTVRTYTLSEIAERKRVTAMTGTGSAPYSNSNAVRWVYDTEMRLIEIEYKGGTINQYQDYDDRGNPGTVRLAAGSPEQRTITYAFHPDMNVPLTRIEVSVVGGGSKVCIWDYDNDYNATPNENPTSLLSRVIEQGFTKNSAGGVVPYEYVTTFTYNGKGQVLSVDGPKPGNSDVTTFTYNETTGDLLSITRPLIGSTTLSDYDAAGMVGRITDVNNLSRTFSWDGMGRITNITNDADGSSTTYLYNTAGQRESVTDPDGITRTFIYDSTYGRLIRVTDPDGNYMAYDYDARGNRIEKSKHYSSGERTSRKRWTYEHPVIPGKLFKEIKGDDTFTEYGYDDDGNIASVTDNEGNTTNYDYDSLNQLRTVTQPGNAITAYGYDTHGNLVSVTDAESHQTTYQSDDMGRVVSTTSPDTGTVTYVYDSSGNLLEKTDARGITTIYTHDNLNRFTAVHYPDSSQDITYTWDTGSNGKGRLGAMTDPSGGIGFDYDNRGRLAGETTTIDSRSFTVSYAYTPGSRLSAITYPTGRTVNYSRNSRGHMEGASTTYQSSTTTLAENITYGPFGPGRGMGTGSGGGVNNTHDESGRLTVANPGEEKERSFQYDANDNLTSIRAANDSFYNHDFAYDALNRLVSATGHYGSITYTYDKVGNRLTKDTDGQTDTYTYLAGTNKLEEIAGENPISLAYDANGNTTALGDNTLVYNQNNRLIRVEEDENVLEEYSYNGRSQRIKKKAGDKTTHFIYDTYGNLISEANGRGVIFKEYVYMGTNRLCHFVYEIPEHIEVSVTTDKGRKLLSINVYAFTESGSYTGLHAVTDEQGIARFEPDDLSDGNYKFRADYLSYQFWSPVITVPGVYDTEIVIEENTAEVTVTAAGEQTEGIKVYLFNENGSYLGQNGITDSNGKVSFALPVGKGFKFRADYLGSQYWSDPVIIGSGDPMQVDLDAGGGILTVTLQKDPDHPMTGVKVYLFTATGSYLSLSDTTGANGQVTYTVSSGTYKVRADYLGYQFWSDEIVVNSDAASTLSIPHQDVTITITGKYIDDIQARENLKVYLFTSSGSYLGKYEVTNDQGQVMFNVPQKDYKVRADYLSWQYWSDTFNWQDTTITINEGVAQVTVTNMGLPLEGVNVYVFSSSGSYLGIHDVTDDEGKMCFRLPAGDYNFRADYMGSQYWSGLSTIIAHVVNPVGISTGGGSFTLTVLKGETDPLVGVTCYLFSDSGSYLGGNGVTNDQGEVSFNLADGSYKIRVDHLGYQFWTEVFSVPGTLALTHTIPHQDVTITVEGDYAGDVEKREDIRVYLFTPSGTYLGKYEVTNDQGQVVFNLPQEDYKVRADYMSQQYFSEIFNWADETVTINEGMAEVHVTQGPTPIENVNVYVFNSSGTYLGIHGQTNEQGIINFRLPEATYKFRADHQGSQYWATEPVTAHQVNVINLNTGGGTFTLTVEKAAASPLVNIPVYVFSSTGSYLGLSGHTDDQGKVTFDLSDGDYKFRADYLGYQFWSDVITIPTTLSDTLTIPHQDVTIAVNEVYGTESDPLENIKVYLFKASGSYLGQYETTNSQGQVTFNLPQEDYKVRADYLSGQYFSEVFMWQDMDVDIDHGRVDVHVTFNGQNVEDAPVYLFTDTGSYLGRYERTDANGHAEFLIPAQSYKFRVDYEGTQYWSDVINVMAHEETDVEMPLEQLALINTNDPNPIRYDGEPPVFEPEGIKVATIGSLAGILSQAMVANTPPPKVYYYLNDHLGRPQIMTDENGVVVWEAKYTPFGEAVVHPYSTVENNFRFPGQYYDSETGLHYNWHRYYDPKIGRYLTPDPIGLAGGINLFIYAASNPINAIDPDGLWALFGGLGLRATLPVVGGEAGAVAVLGSEGKGFRAKLSLYAEAFIAGGLSIGRGFWGGFWTGDVCEMDQAIEVGIDTPVGSISFLIDKKLNFGLILGGPALVAGSFLKMEEVSVKKSWEIIDETNRSISDFLVRPAY